MQQLGMFKEAGQSLGLPKKLLEYHPGLFTEKESDVFLEHFIYTSPWQQRTVMINEKEVIIPRLTAWYADAANS